MAYIEGDRDKFQPLETASEWQAHRTEHTAIWYQDEETWMDYRDIAIDLIESTSHPLTKDFNHAVIQEDLQLFASFEDVNYVQGVLTDAVFAGIIESTLTHYNSRYIRTHSQPFVRENKKKYHLVTYLQESKNNEGYFPGTKVTTDAYTDQELRGYPAGESSNDIETYIDLPILYVKDKKKGTVTEMIYAMRDISDAQTLQNRFRTILGGISLESFDSELGMNIHLFIPTDPDSEQPAEELYETWEQLKNEFDDAVQLSEISLEISAFPITEEYLTDAVMSVYGNLFTDADERISQSLQAQEMIIEVPQETENQEKEEAIELEKPEEAPQIEDTAEKQETTGSETLHAIDVDTLHKRKPRKRKKQVQNPSKKKHREKREKHTRPSASDIPQTKTSEVEKTIEIPVVIEQAYLYIQNDKELRGSDRVEQIWRYARLLASNGIGIFHVNRSVDTNQPLGVPPIFAVARDINQLPNELGRGNQDIAAWVDSIKNTLHQDRIIRRVLPTIDAVRQIYAVDATEDGVKDILASPLYPHLREVIANATNLSPEKIDQITDDILFIKEAGEIYDKKPYHILATVGFPMGYNDYNDQFNYDLRERLPSAFFRELQNFHQEAMKKVAVHPIIRNYTDKIIPSILKNGMPPSVLAEVKNVMTQLYSEYDAVLQIAAEEIAQQTHRIMKQHITEGTVLGTPARDDYLTGLAPRIKEVFTKNYTGISSEDITVVEMAGQNPFVLPYFLESIRLLEFRYDPYVFEQYRDSLSDEAIKENASDEVKKVAALLKDPLLLTQLRKEGQVDITQEQVVTRQEYDTVLTDLILNEKVLRRILLSDCIAKAYGVTDKNLEVNNADKATVALRIATEMLDDVDLRELFTAIPVDTTDLDEKIRAANKKTSQLQRQGGKARKQAEAAMRDYRQLLTQKEELLAPSTPKGKLIAEIQKRSPKQDPQLQLDASDSRERFTRYLDVVRARKEQYRKDQNERLSREIIVLETLQARGIDVARSTRELARLRKLQEQFKSHPNLNKESAILEAMGSTDNNLEEAISFTWEQQKYVTGSILEQLRQMKYKF